jgi:2-dehydro-3-deoxygluconokinase
MTAGLIHGIVSGWTAQQTIEFAAAAACLKHSSPGDFYLVSLAEVQGLIAHGGSGRIQR